MIELSDGSTLVEVNETGPVAKSRLYRYVRKFLPSGYRYALRQMGCEGVEVKLKGLLDGSSWLTDKDKLQAWHGGNTLLDYWDGVEEVNPIEIADDGQAAFWTLVKMSGGSNLIDVSVADDSTKQQRGLNCLKITAVSGSTCARWYLRHNYGSAQDWSAKAFFVLYWYGASSGSVIRIVINGSSGAWTDKYLYTFTDNWTGWKRLVIAKSSFTVEAGSPSWATVYAVQIEQGTENKTATWYMDRMAFDAAVKITEHGWELVPGWAEMLRVNLILNEV